VGRSSNDDEGAIISSSFLLRILQEGAGPLTSNQTSKVIRLTEGRRGSNLGKERSLSSLFFYFDLFFLFRYS
jgi:hypothetical protein